MDKDTIKELIHKMGIEELVFEELEDQESPLWRVIMGAVVLSILRKLPKEDKQTFIQMLEKEDGIEDVLKFVGERVPDVTDVVKRAIDEEFEIIKDGMKEDTKSE